MGIFSGVKKVFGRGRVLYYPGCMTQSDKDLLTNYKSILSDIGINFIIAPKMPCCGFPAYTAGYRKEFSEILAKNKKLLKGLGISKIISNCPHCVWAFKNLYKMEVEHTNQTLAGNSRKLQAVHSGEINLHDSCFLARKMGSWREPRIILRSLGFRIDEMKRSKTKTFCCGSVCNDLSRNNPVLGKKIAHERLKEATKRLVTTCPYCYKHLKQNSKDVKVFEISELLIE